MPDVLCPSCKEQIEPGAARCAGQVVAHSLITCDTDFCYYEGTPGGVA